MAGTWVKRGLGAAAATWVGLSTGCSTMSNTTTGGLAGGALGAGAGTLIGAATGNPKTGALVGGLLGAGVGTAVGADADRQERAEIRRTQAEIAQAQAAAQPGPLSMEDIVNMSKPNPQTGARVSDDVMVDYIRSSHSRFDLSPADIRYLTDNGVSDRVVREMMNTKTSRVSVGPPRTVVVQEPPVVVYERPYPLYRPYYYAPPPPIGFGFSYVKVR
jgi:hypothetical protein